MMVLLRLHFIGLQALLALHDLEGDRLAFLQGLETGALDRTEMDKQVLAAFRGDDDRTWGVTPQINSWVDTRGLSAPRLSSQG